MKLLYELYSFKFRFSLVFSFGFTGSLTLNIFNMKWRNYKLTYLVKCEKLLISTNLINFEDKLYNNFLWVCSTISTSRTWFSVWGRDILHPYHIYWKEGTSHWIFLVLVCHLLHLFAWLLRVFVMFGLFTSSVYNGRNLHD